MEPEIVEPEITNWYRSLEFKAAASVLKKKGPRRTEARKREALRKENGGIMRGWAIWSKVWREVEDQLPVQTLVDHMKDAANRLVEQVLAELQMELFHALTGSKARLPTPPPHHHHHSRRCGRFAKWSRLRVCSGLSARPDPLQ